MIKPMIFHVRDLDELDAAARTMLHGNPEQRIFYFFGEMGSGKTTMIRALCRLLGSRQPVSSPTFPLVNEYESAAGEKIYHFDFFRINSIEEAYDIGTSEYFNSGCYCFVEWAEKIGDAFGNDAAGVYIEVRDDQRNIRVGELPSGQ